MEHPVSVHMTATWVALVTGKELEMASAEMAMASAQVKVLAWASLQSEPQCNERTARHQARSNSTLMYASQLRGLMEE